VIFSFDGIALSLFRLGQKLFRIILRQIGLGVELPELDERARHHLESARREFAVIA